MDTFLYHVTTITRRLKVNKFFNVRKPPWRNMLQSNNNCSLTLNLHQQQYAPYQYRTEFLRFR